MLEKLLHIMAEIKADNVVNRAEMKQILIAVFKV